jgi:hypothetical protein
MGMYERTTMMANSFEQYAEELDIPESRYLEAINRYESIGAWLSKDDSMIAKYAPKIYPQGSFCLGTVVKPINDDYDIDLVCYFENLQKEETTQGQLKKMVGDRLLQNDVYKKILDREGNRCWTLNYANEFHMDILPAIADNELRARQGLYAEAVLITDKEKIMANDQDWPRSNPKGYAKWFSSRQERVFTIMKNSLAESLKAKVDDIPDYKIKTPLQRAVQILKRHRDYYYTKKNADYKPISIVITTIAGMLYKGQDNIYNAIYDILLGIDENVVRKTSDGYYIPNPANPEENFADKWNDDPKLAQAFFEWVKEAREAFCSESILEKSDSKELSEVLARSLGVKIPDKIPTRERTSITMPPYVKTSPSNERRPWGNG